MKNVDFKFGFSLMEVLIALAIVSVIATMGFSVAKRGIERAYNQFYFTGYDTLGDLLREAYYNEGGKITPNTDEFCAKIVLLALPGSSCSGGEITATNKIKYKVVTSMIEGEGDEQKTAYIIDMTVPTVKKKNNSGESTTRFIHLPEEPSVWLAPIAGGDINIGERLDLLTCVVSDGKEGKIIKDNGKFEYTPYSAYYNYYDAYCATHESLIFNGTTYISCSGGPSKKDAIVKVRRPGRYGK